MVVFTSELRRAAAATVAMWLPVIAAGPLLGVVELAPVAVVGLVLTWIAVRICASRASVRPTAAMAAALWASPAALVGVAFAVPVGMDAGRGRMPVPAVLFVLVPMAVAAGIGALAAHVALRRAVAAEAARAGGVSGAPRPRVTRIHAIVGASIGVLAFDVLSGVTMTTDCVVDGSCRAGFPFAYEGRWYWRVSALLTNLGLVASPVLWLGMLRTPVARARAMGVVGLLVTLALLGTALVASDPDWFGYRLWNEGRWRWIFSR